jgi:hypothetical protein
MLTSMTAESNAPAQVAGDLTPPAVIAPPPSPTPVISPEELRAPGGDSNALTHPRSVITLALSLGPLAAQGLQRIALPSPII